MVRLLAVCCLAAGLLLLTWEPRVQKQIQTAAEVDSLIHTTLQQFSIPERQIRTQTVRIDTIATRKVYTVNVPRHLSQTEWHYELDRKVRPYRVGTPATVRFPEQDLDIQLTYNNRVIRTVRLRSTEEIRHSEDPDTPEQQIPDHP